MSETTIARVQTGVRLEASMLNVLKALAALKGMTLGDLIEGIVLHAFEGGSAFSAETLNQIRDLRKVYGLRLRASDSHTLVESSQPRRAGAKRRRKS
jgi:predicted DNA-binding ribbon-helix-helix protein